MYARHSYSFTVGFSPLAYSCPSASILFSRICIVYECGAVVIVFGLARIFWIVMRVRSRSSYRPSKITTNARKHIDDRACCAIAECDKGIRSDYDGLRRHSTFLDHTIQRRHFVLKKLFDLLTAKDKTELSWYFLYPLVCLGGWAGLRLDRW